MLLHTSSFPSDDVGVGGGFDNMGKCKFAFIIWFCGFISENIRYGKWFTTNIKHSLYSSKHSNSILCPPAEYLQITLLILLSAINYNKLFGFSCA